LALALGTVVPILLALGTHFPFYGTLWHHFGPLRYPRVPERIMPVACLALAGLVGFAAAPAARRFAAVVAVGLVALFADLRLGVTAYRVARADQGNAAYTALRARPSGRLLELPVLHPSVNHGSVYLYYDMQAQRERPGGYSTLAPKDAATRALRLGPLSCGDSLPGAGRLLRRLGVCYGASHGGLFSRGSGWCGWRAA